MSPLLTTRRSLWLPGVAVIGAALAVGSMLGFTVGTRHWAWFLGFFITALLAMGWIERFWQARREAKKEPRARGKLRVIRGGKPDYDLENDDRTDNQRYLM
jgi:hypothetical protein